MKKNNLNPLYSGIVFLALLIPNLPACAQTISTQQLVQDVIYNELQANIHDHTKWMYRDDDQTPGKDTIKLVVQTDTGTVSKTLLLNDHPLTPPQQQQDDAKMESVVNNPSVRAKQHKNGEHDDNQATSLMTMLPNAFIWTLVGESNNEITLRFKPNPAFQPPTYASRVFAAMAGEMVVDAAQKRLKVLSGTLIQPVEFGWGILGRLQKGGTFRVVHTEVAPGLWQITQTHVHINGRALFFKSISEQEDEISSDYKKTADGMTPKQAVEMLTDGTIAKELGISPEK